jgi:hypothetical protein
MDWFKGTCAPKPHDLNGKIYWLRWKNEDFTKSTGLKFTIELPIFGTQHF